MAKDLRLSTALPPVQHWSTIPGPYRQNEIDGIPDPNGAMVSGTLTSIPSPFAAMEMVRAAFAQLAKPNANLMGNTIHHRLVSFTLDVMEILFNYDSLKKDIDLIPWNPSGAINTLVKSPNRAHNILGETLQLYWQQDSVTFNFGNVKNFWIIKYNFQIIGGTSPVTVFFPTNNRVTISTRLTGGQPFLDPAILTPLWGRDAEFIKYLFSFRTYYNTQSQNQFASHFQEFDGYLNNTLTLLFAKKYDLWETLKGQFNNSNHYLTTYVPIQQGLEVLGVQLLGRPASTEQIAQNSDFVIKSSKNSIHAPLVLEDTYEHHEELKYAGSNSFWDSKIKIPPHDPNPIDKRFLPNTKVNYPYLTVNDFLAPCLIKLPYKSNKAAFKTLVGEKTDYLLPLTELFFDYFSPTDLLTDQPQSGKPSIFVNESKGGEVEVSLRIPIGQGTNYVTLRRVYKSTTSTSGTNEGKLLAVTLGLGVSPLLDTGQDDSSFYRAGLVHKAREASLTLSFADDSSKMIDSQEVFSRTDTPEPEQEPVQYISLEQKRFSLLRFGISTDLMQTEAYIIPVFQRVPVNGGVHFTFGVDFGTTNTHVEYKTSQQPSPRAFTITEQDKQVHYLHDPSTDFGPLSAFFIPNSFDWTFLPTLLGDKEGPRMPQRTVLARPRGVSVSNLRPMANSSIPFSYGRTIRLPIPKKSHVESDLKWDTSDMYKTKLFLDELVFMLRNKVLLNDGTLEETEVRWLYPSSMSDFQRSHLEDFWQELLRKYFGKARQRSITESVAPYYYLSNFAQVNGSVLSIDIGGGTTDVVYFEKNQIKGTTSFQFAAGAVFGDAFNGSYTNNGFVKKFKSRISQAIKEALNDASNSIVDSEDFHRSTEIINILFSIEESVDLQRKNPARTAFLSELIKNDDIRIIIALYYAALIYHLNKFLKASKLNPPRHISFSGNGAKMIALLGSNRIIENYTRILFQKFGEATFDFDIKYPPSPKEMTAKGALFVQVTNETIENTIFMGFDSKLAEGEKYADIKEDSALMERIADEVQKFIDLFVQVLKEQGENLLGLENNKGLFDLVKTEFSKKDDLVNFVSMGIQNRKDEDTIKETLFFYPIIGKMNILATQISNLQKNG